MKKKFTEESVEEINIENGKEESPRQIELFDKAQQERVRKQEKHSPVVFACIIALFTLLIAALTEYYLGDPLGIFPFLENPLQAQDATTEHVYGAVDVRVLSLDRADCSVITYSDGSCMLIDAGREQDAATIQGQLNDLGIEKITTLVLTCASSEHIGGMSAVAGMFQVEHFICPHYPDEPESLTVLKTQLAAQGTAIEEVAILPSDRGPYEIPFTDSVSVTALSPFSGTYDSEADYSLIVRVEFGSTAMLFTGDATVNAERIAIKALHNRYFHANILMLGSHGGADSSSDKLLGTVGAQIAIASCGEDGPAKSVLKQLRNYEMTLIRTDQAGNIHVRLDGENASVVE